MQEIIYGIGGHDPTKPNNNIIEVIEHPDPEPTPLETAMAKLTALGLSEDEAKAIAGL
jgi:hypothetical protein